MIPVKFVGDDKDYKYGCNNLGYKQKIVELEPSTEYNPFIWHTEYKIVTTEKRNLKEFFKSFWYLVTHKIIIKEEIC